DTWDTVPVASPSARTAAASAVFDGKLVLFGGSSGPQTALGELWEWDGVSWTQRTFATGPSARFGASMVALGSKLVMVGGKVGNYDYQRLGAGQVFDETWEWDGFTWQQRALHGLVPPPRAHASFAVRGGNAVLFGGITYVGNDAKYLGDTWEYDGEAWTE